MKIKLMVLMYTLGVILLILTIVSSIYGHYIGIDVLILCSLLMIWLNIKKEEEKRQKIDEVDNYKAVISDVFKYSSDLIFLKDTKGKYITCNKIFANKMKFTDESAIEGLSDRDFVSEEDFLQIRKIDDYVIKNQLPVKYIRPMKMFHDGVYELKLSPFVQKGKVQGVFGVARNIKEKIDLENYIQMQKAQVASILDSIASMAYLKDINNNIITANKSFLKFLGCNEEDINKPGILDKFKIINEQSFQTDRIIIETKITKRMDIEVQAPYSTFWFDTQKSPFFDIEGNVIGIMVLCTDITQRKNMEEELIKAKEDALALNNLKTQMIANITHEIKTPLSGIIGFLDLIAEQINTEKCRVYIEKARKFAHILLELITTLLEFSQLECKKIKLDMNVFNLQKMLIDALEFINKKAGEKNIKIDFDYDESIPENICGDSTKIFQVINNLLDNSLKFTDRGKISLITRLVDLNEKETEIYFEIRDTGIGIREEDKNTVFEPFIQGDLSSTKKYQGTGLGLHNCKGFLEAMGSKIFCESIVGEGTKMFFTVKFSNEAVPSISY